MTIICACELVRRLGSGSDRCSESAPAPVQWKPFVSAEELTRIYCHGCVRHGFEMACSRMTLGDHKYRAISRVRLPPELTAAAALEVFPETDHTCLLDSAMNLSGLGRYSFFCADPFLVFHSKRRRAFAGPPGDIRPLERDPLIELSEILKRYRSMGAARPDEEMPPFLGGAVGYLGYELLYLIEDVPDLGRDNLPGPDCYLLFFDTVIASNLERGVNWLVVNGFGTTQAEAETRASQRQEAALEHLRALHLSNDETRRASLTDRRAKKLLARHRLTDAALEAASVRPVVNHEGYLRIVQGAKDEIFRGNIFEVCTTNRFDTTFSGSSLDLYRILRTVSPSPFAAYLRFPEFEVLSSSPERFVSVNEERLVETRPIKGTRPRGRTGGRTTAIGSIWRPAKRTPPRT